MIRDAFTMAGIIGAILVIATEWHHYQQSRELDSEHSDDRTGVSVACVNWSADSNRLLALYRGDSGEADQLVLHDLDHSTRSRPIVAGLGLISASVLLSDGAALLVADEAARIWRIDVGSNASVQVAALPSGVVCSAIAAGPNDNSIAIGAGDGSLLLNDGSLLTGESESRAHRGPISSLKYSRDGLRLISSSMDGTVKIWDIDARRLVATLVGHAGSVTDASFVSDGRQALSCGLDNTLRLWDVGTAREIWRSEGPGAPGALCVDVSANGEFAACGGFGTVCLIDLASRQKLASLAVHAAAAKSLRFSPDGLSLATGCIDGTICLWNVADWSVVDWIGAPTRDKRSRR